MRPNWDEKISQLAAAVDAWRILFPQLPKTFPLAQGFAGDTFDLGLKLDESLSTLNVINQRENIDSVTIAIHQQTVFTAVNAISAAVEGLKSNPTAVNLLDQIAQHCWSLRTSLVWLVPSGGGMNHIQHAIESQDVEAKAAALSRLSAEYSQEVNKIIEASQGILGLVKDASEANQRIVSYERESSTAKTNVEASAAVAASSKEAVEKQLSELTAGLEQYRRLQDEVEALKLKAVSTLESTSKVGLAASFAARKDDLNAEKQFWQWAFAVGIVVTIGVAFISILGVFTLPPMLKDGNVEIGPILTRLIVFGPLVWFTWFSVRQYGTAARLSEDYAFKEASALAFVGYQREMAQDPEMIKLLRESAIKNFGNQPTRIFEKVDPASPLHELLDKALEKGATDKFIELIKALVPGKN